MWKILFVVSKDVVIVLFDMQNCVKANSRYATAVKYRMVIRLMSLCLSCACFLLIPCHLRGMYLNPFLLLQAMALSILLVCFYTLDVK